MRIGFYNRFLGRYALGAFGVFKQRAAAGTAVIFNIAVGRTGSGLFGVLYGVRSKLEKCNIPEFLKGLPITLIAASIVALSFLGFAGMA